MGKYSEQLIEEISNNTYRDRNINLTSNKITNTQAINLANALNKNTFIKVVFLSDNNISDSGIKALAALENLEVLTVDRNDFGSEGVQALAKSNLQKLDISHNEVCDSIAHFSENTRLKELDAIECKITSVGVTLLAKGNCTLKILYLEHNKIDDEGAKALMQIKSLTRLNLAFNFISDKRSFNDGNHIKDLYTNNNPCHIGEKIDRSELKPVAFKKSASTDNAHALKNLGKFSPKATESKEESHILASQPTQKP